MKTFYLLNFLLFVLISNQSFSQDDTSNVKTKKYTHVIKKNDGSEYIGRILSDDGREVLIETENLGKIYIQKDNIKSINTIENESSIVHGEFSSTGPFTTRYAFTNNALPIKKGENYALINLFGPEAHFALTDNFNIGVISTWIASPMVLAMKYTMKTKSPKVNFSLGTLLGTSGYINNFRSYGGVHWLSMTLGDRKNNVTFSSGYFYLETGSRSHALPGVYENYQIKYGKKPISKGPVISVAGIVKVGAKASFIFDSMLAFTEISKSQEVTTDIVPGIYRTTVTNIVQQTEILVFMPGMRFQKDERKAFQISLAGVSINKPGDNVSFPFPMATWFYKF